jgi:hypothetical protein
MTTQMSCRVSDGVKAAFGAYAGKLGLHDSELARLLIARERHHRQLEAFVKAGGAASPPASSAATPPKITAHFSSPTVAAEFDAYAANCGLGSGPIKWIPMMGVL